MAKKRNRIRRSHSKCHHLFLTFLDSKVLWMLFCLLLSLLLVVGSTYAWITYSDERINHTQMTVKELSLLIDELFKPDLQWRPGKETEKRVTVQNNGQIPAIARVSLYEFLLQFEVDLRDGEGVGNGGLKKVNKASSQPIEAEQLSTWKVGNTYDASGVFFVASSVFLSDTQNSETAYKYKATPSTEGLAYLTLHFNESAIYDSTNPPHSNLQDYWYYESGYFYYSEVLQPGDSTIPLLTSVSLAETIPNEYKGALYQLVPVMDGHDISKQLLDDWQLSGPVASLYNGKLH